MRPLQVNMSHQNTIARYVISHNYMMLMEFDAAEHCVQADVPLGA